MKRAGLHFGKQLLLILVLVVMVVVLLECAAPTPAPAPAPAPALAPTPAPPGEAVTIDLTAKGIAYGKSTITVPAGALVIINFDNKDNIPHNLAVYESRSASKKIFRGEIISGEIIRYEFTAPTTPGTYFFRCDVHPSSMTGEFIVTGNDYVTGDDY